MRHHRPGDSRGREVDRLGGGPEAGVGANHPGNEADGRHAGPQCPDLGRGGHEHRRRRIGENPGYKYNADRNGTTFHGKQGERIQQSAAKKGSQFIESTKGRWPANLLLDEDAAAQLDEQTGTLTSGNNNVRTKPGDGYHGGMGRAGDAQVSYGDSGGASRFFYCGKATKRERGPGNDHPTVKPLDLMKYLLTLLSTPDGGVILDPFAGSGTTLLAAQQLGRRSIGVELIEHNCEIAKSRLQA